MGDESHRQTCLAGLRIPFIPQEDPEAFVSSNCFIKRTFELPIIQIDLVSPSEGSCCRWVPDHSGWRQILPIAQNSGLKFASDINSRPLECEVAMKMGAGAARREAGGRYLWHTP
jgi:hypothetical protein